MQEDMSYNKGSAYKVNFWYMSKNDSVNIMNGSCLGYFINFFYYI